MALAIHIIIILLFVTLGIVFLNGKGADLIAGYNTLPEYKKAEFDQKALCRSMAKMMFGLAIAWGMSGIGSALSLKWLFWTGLALFFAVIIFFLIYMNTGNRFKGKK